MATIAVIGWGSLIWRPSNLQVASRWRTDGPLLPIEFARTSQDGRLTLVIHPGSANVATYWAASKFSTMTEARENLCEREGTTLENIHYLDKAGSSAKGAQSDILARIREWQDSRPVEAVIWTGLSSNWVERRKRKFTVDDALLYLKELEDRRYLDGATYSLARDYVTNAPSQIDTVVRKIMRGRGWRDSKLPDDLFCGSTDEGRR